MYKIVDETWLTKLVDVYGETALVEVMSTVYGSGLFKFFLTTFVTLGLFSLGLGIHKRSLSPKAIFTVLAYLLIYPVDKKPAAYVVIDSLGRATRSVFEKSIISVVSSSKGDSKKQHMPPGIVLDMIVQAATTKVEDQQCREKIHAFVVNCLPNALCTNGDNATFDDIFHYMPRKEVNRYSTDSSGDRENFYGGEKLDLKALSKDLSYSNYLPGKNCRDGYDMMRDALHEKARNNNGPLLVNRVVNHGKDETTESWWNDFSNSSGGKFLRQLAGNLSQAVAAAYEKSEIIANVGSTLASIWHQRTGTDASLRELLAANGDLTSLGYHLSDGKDLLANSFRSRWAFSLGVSIKDLKERIELMPYYLAAIRLLLKFILPFFVLTLFFQTFRYLFLWAGAWITTLLVPAIISALRAIGNSILLSKLGIESLRSSAGDKSLVHGIDLKVATNFLDDFVPLAYALINQEIKIISILSGCVLVGGWLSGGGANGFVSWLSNSVQGTMANRAAAASSEKLASAAKVVSQKAVLPAIAMTAGGLSFGASMVVSSLRNEDSTADSGVKTQEATNWKLPKRN